MTFLFQYLFDERALWFIPLRLKVQHNQSFFQEDHSLNIFQNSQMQIKSNLDDFGYNTLVNSKSINFLQLNLKVPPPAISQSSVAK